MKIQEALSLATTVICMMALPTYVGYKLNNIALGIIVAGVASISYVLYFAIKRK